MIKTTAWQKNIAKPQQFELFRHYRLSKHNQTRNNLQIHHKKYGQIIPKSKFHGMEISVQLPLNQQLRNDPNWVRLIFFSLWMRHINKRRNTFLMWTISSIGFFLCELTASFSIIFNEFFSNWIFFTAGSLENSKEWSGEVSTMSIVFV